MEQQVLLVVWRLRDGAYGASVHDELERRTERSVIQGTIYVTLVLKGGLTLVAVGGAAGIVVSLGLGRLVERFLVGVASCSAW